MLTRKSGPALTSVARLAVLPVALLAFTAAISAQTAPQLLPYTSVLVAGGASANPAKGATCPVSGNISLDAFGDGCTATEINIAPTSTSATGARFVVTDRTGAIFFSDATNSLVRRIDPTTGVVTVVVGGASSNPTTGATCGTGVSTDINGDGCPGNLIKISRPMGLAFDPAGNLYFVDEGFDEVRKVAATGGLVTTTGIVTNIAGNVSTFGYNVNNTATSGVVIAATQSYLNFPYGITFDAAGNLYIADEGNNALEVVNLTAAVETLQGMTVPAGTIAKFAGYGSLAAKTATSGDCPDFVSTSARGGCYFGSWTDGHQANVSNNDGVYALALDTSNNVYFSNEFNNNVGMVTPANVISNYAGIQASAAKKVQRGVAGSFGIGSVFGVAIDPLNNLYVGDASLGAVWRVDATTKNMYVVAGGATTTCAAATDTYGDGCPATQATFGHSGSGNFATTTLPGPGIFGIYVDANANVFAGDTETGLIREISSGTQFGNIGANQPVDTLDIHFAPNDTPAGSAYVLTAGASNFSLGSATCTFNSNDKTVDCLLPVTATPTVTGPFTGTLKVTSTLGGISTFQLSGNFVASPKTRSTISASVAACSGTNTVTNTTPVTLTATLISNGATTPTGAYNFYANGSTTPLNTTPVPLTNIGTAGAPVYGAIFTYTFATAGSYAVSATFVPTPASYYQTSTSSTSATVVSSTPTLSLTSTGFQQGTVTAGQTALYSFTMPSVYSGTVSFAVTGLPTNSTYTLNPPTAVTLNGCQASTTFALSIITQQKTTVQPGSLVAGRGMWRLMTAFAGVLLALAIGLRRRRIRFAQVWMVLALLVATTGIAACGKSVGSVLQPATPSGTYTITVTGTGSAGASPAPLTFQLIVQ